MNLLKLFQSNSAPKTYAQRRRVLVWSFNGIAAAACCFSIFAAQAYLKPAAETYGMGEMLASFAAFATGATLDIILIYSLRSFVADLTAQRCADGILLAVFAAAATAYGYFLTIATENRANADTVAMYQPEPTPPADGQSINPPTLTKATPTTREAEARAIAAEARKQEAGNAARAAAANDREEVIRLNTAKHNNSKTTATLLLCLALVMQAAAGYITNKRDDTAEPRKRARRPIEAESATIETQFKTISAHDAPPADANAARELKIKNTQHTV